MVVFGRSPFSSHVAILSNNRSRDASNRFSTFPISLIQMLFPFRLGELLHPPERLLSEDASPLVLEEESDLLKHVDGDTALQAHAHVVGLHVEAASRHAPLHQHPLLCWVLADRPVHPFKPPKGELDGSAEEPDHTHDFLIHEGDPVPSFKHSDSF